MGTNRLTQQLTQIIVWFKKAASRSLEKYIRLGGGKTGQQKLKLSLEPVEKLSPFSAPLPLLQAHAGPTPGETQHRQPHSLLFPGEMSFSPGRKLGGRLLHQVTPTARRLQHGLKLARPPSRPGLEPDPRRCDARQSGH